MAKKDKKKKDTPESGAADAVEAVRAAVERTFRATTEGAAGTQKRTRELVDEVAHAAARIRDDLRLLEDVRGLRGEVEALSRRVAALEAAKSAATKTRSTRARSTASKPSGTRSSAQRPAPS